MIRYLILSFLYPLSYKLAISIIKRLPSDHKLHQWLRNRALKPLVQNSYAKNKSTVLFSCASLGEYESIKMIAFALKASHNIQLMFFSPSGYDPMTKRTEEWDVLSYSPFDSPKDIDTSISILQPDTVVISSNDVWPQFLNQLIKRNIPYLIVGATYQQNTRFKSLYYRILYPYFRNSMMIYTHSISTLDFLSNHSVKATLTPNIRLASIWHDNHHSSIELPKAFLEFCRLKPVIIFGSVYPLEIEKIIAHQDQLIKRFQIIIVSHGCDDETNEELNEQMPKSILWSNIDQFNGHNVLIVNRFGILKHLYQHCAISYVGGGFHNGIHNVFESAIHHTPTIIGPKYQRFPEVSELVENGIIDSINQVEELIPAIINHPLKPINPERLNVDILETQNAAKLIADYINSLTKS